jgi:hypothetical protein
MGQRKLTYITYISLWGITCVQTFEYFMDCKGDRLRQKLVVSLLLPSLSTLSNPCLRSRRYGEPRLQTSYLTLAHSIIRNSAIDTFSSAVNALTVYNYTITNYANPSVIVTATW